MLFQHVSILRAFKLNNLLLVIFNPPYTNDLKLTDNERVK